MLVLKIAILLLVFLLSISTSLLGILASLLVLFAILAFFTVSKANGLWVLVIAWLISPYGIPLAADWLLNRLNDLWDWMQGVIYY